jgi:hypothetical protein
MCPAQPYHVEAQFVAWLSLPMKHNLRLFLLVLISGFTKLPVMKLAKQHFASLREINTLSNHACNQKGNPLVADVVLVLNC